MSVLEPSLLQRYDGNLPRYTSYPTAVRFSEAVGSGEASDWLKEISAGEALSLYLHVPFCDELCGFCGCNTSVMRSVQARADYALSLMDELRRIADLLPGTPAPVTHLQFGGGTPTTLPEHGFRSLFDYLRSRFLIASDAEISIELDPRHFDNGMARFLAELGFNRGSLGVQDIDPRVQQACGRIQSLEQTRACVSALRDAGFSSVNIDLIYGLPHQTADSTADTAAHIAGMRPDRLAVFGYAHVPWKARRQQVMPEDALPDRDSRIAQRNAIDQTLKAAGYVAIGLDHYALPHDTMAQAASHGILRRNFQGYTTDRARYLIGVGASAISSLPGGFTQNIVSAAAYEKALKNSDALPVARGVSLTDEDRVRGALIERLMCDLAVNLEEFGPDRYLPERRRLEMFASDGLVKISGSNVSVTETGRLFIRNIASVFDRYLPVVTASARQHSRAL